jgi:hypothetical protein
MQPWHLPLQSTSKPPTFSNSSNVLFPLSQTLTPYLPLPANARALYGRHFTYDVITAQPPFSGVPWSPDYTDTKVHVLLVAYPLSDPSAKAKIIKGAVSIGKKSVAPNMSAALRELWRMLQRDMAAFTGM